MKGRRDVSSSLLEAQERLLELREIVREKDGAASPFVVTHGRSPACIDKLNSQPDRLPKRVGWGSEPLTKVLRAALLRADWGDEPHETSGTQEEGECLQEVLAPDQPQQLTETAPSKEISAQVIKLYPDIALALLRGQLVAPGRLWLLLRYIDPTGRGWIEIGEARRLLTKKQSALRAIGWRQMRKLLTRGEGLFWRRDGRRIWLRSPLKVAVSLGIDRLRHQPVGLPTNILLQSIGTVRAHFYASFHSGRTSDKETGGRPAPISRAALQTLCQTSRRTLRHYERRAGVHSQRNYAIGKSLTVSDHQNQAWERGRAVFKIRDQDGRAGREGATYTAWQLPNSYSGPHKPQPKGRQKRMNRKLADLFMKGMTGNDERTDRTHQDGGAEERRFFDSGVAATKNYNRKPEHDLYWRGHQQNAFHGLEQCQLWHWLPPQCESRRRQESDLFEPAGSGTE